LEIPLRRSFLQHPGDPITGRGISGLVARARDERGFTLIEMIFTAVILAIVSAPIAGVLLASAGESVRARERTAADQIVQTKLETIRTLSYAQVGLTGGNPPGTLAASVSTSLPSGEKVTVTTQATYVTDSIPTAYVTHADYKKVVVTILRQSDGAKLSQDTTYVASASAPPLAGTGWIQIKRQVVDAVTAQPIVGASVDVTGGPPGAPTRTDTTDGSGTVLFPALDSSSSLPPPSYTLAATMAGYSVFPDDLPPLTPEQVGASPGLNSTATIRMYLPASLTVNVQTSAGTAYTAGATVSLESSRCGVTTVSIPAGQSSTTVTTCDWAKGKTISLVPNVLGQSPVFDKYGATAWSSSGGLWGAATPFTVPSGYPATLTQTATVKFGSTTYATTKQVRVTVTKGGSPDTNARVNVTGGPAGVYLYGATDSSGTVTLTIPVTSTASTYTVSANDQGAASGTATFTASTGSTSPIASAVAIS
jgi:prepilin-type N-terminal cleavage/methylation domain-containing protein